METIGRGTWIDKLAHELVEREEALGRDTEMINVESGLGASGIPHMGSLGDAVRAYGVGLAVGDMGHSFRLIAYFDDLDGLRKVPEGMPSSLEEHIARPVSAIPDPYGCHDSYGMHMSGLLLEGLDALGIEYDFRRARDTYRDGLLAEQIHRILSNSSVIGEKIAEMVGQEKFRSSLPYFAVCEQCGKMYTAESVEYLADSRKVRYRCGDAEVGGRKIAGCGHEGEADTGGAGGKLAWKVEFAARWQAFDVRFEAYGKDIMDSVRINDWVSDEILSSPHPHHTRYEMFLDKGGKKISKSSGNVVTPQKWLRYGTPQSILLLMYKRITGARELGLEDVPSLMDEYGDLQREYFAGGGRGGKAREAKNRGLFEYTNLLEAQEGPRPHAGYRLLVELSRLFRENRTERVTKKLVEYGVIDGPSPGIERLIALAGNYADDMYSAERTEVELDGATRGALSELAEMLGSAPEGGLQDVIYGVAKSHGVPPRDFFKALYRIILDASSGPRIGPFIEDIGREKVAGMIRGRL
uniref:Lysine--tRNA ligase n=1 Tax=Cenarchaeum symbiosum TaxID=46770 RepID=SYK_CENSM|nr:RecName: Full=Lysine--tRNA ligase; AltName: Full=Lysyl-tRNA synthetase; Short=LysRS [Cenarchaeum symbiosum]AAC62702.1 lysyl tRNA synthetase [Cenarchaeum symbiosum]